MSPKHTRCLQRGKMNKMRRVICDNPVSHAQWREGTLPLPGPGAGKRLLASSQLVAGPDHPQPREGLDPPKERSWWRLIEFDGGVWRGIPGLEEGWRGKTIPPFRATNNNPTRPYGRACPSLRLRDRHPPFPGRLVSQLPHHLRHDRTPNWNGTASIGCRPFGGASCRQVREGGG